MKINGFNLEDFSSIYSQAINVYPKILDELLITHFLDNLEKIIDCINLYEKVVNI